MLKQHIFQNVIKFNGQTKASNLAPRNAAAKFNPRYFLLRNGIAQGSIVSCLLCSLYYGHMEAEHLQKFTAGMISKRIFLLLILQSPLTNFR